MADQQPTVSIITAAYNRSNVLRYAMDSVLRSSFHDWEHIIVNDASTDDTSEIVRSYSDPRIRLIELNHNTGEQSGPNNEGFKHSRGAYIAYISQDDIWFEDHLDSLMATTREMNADWALALGFIAVSKERVVFGRAFPHQRYSPRYCRDVPASLWLVKRSVLHELGGWRSCMQTRLPPSQDLLLRAHAAGKCIIQATRPTAVLVQSGLRRDTYTNRDETENRSFFEAIRTDPRYREKLLLSAALRADREAAELSLDVRAAFAALLKTALKRVSVLCHIPPMKLYFLLRYFRKGSFINALRRRRGLPELGRAS